MKAASTALLACDVFSEEVSSIAGGSSPWRAVEWLEMGLHDHPDRLREAIQGKLLELESLAGVERIVLLYGLCGNGLLGIRAGQVALVVPRADDCVAILLGRNERRAALLRQRPSLYFYSPGWIRGKRVPGPDREATLREHYATRFAGDPEMIDELVEADRDAFRHHTTAAYVDITGNKAAETYCANCARHLGWDFERLSGDSTWLRDLLTGEHSDPHRFLTVLPGQSIALDSGGGLVARSVPS